MCKPMFQEDNICVNLFNNMEFVWFHRFCIWIVIVGILPTQLLDCDSGYILLFNAIDLSKKKKNREIYNLVSVPKIQTQLLFPPFNGFRMPLLLKGGKLKCLTFQLHMEKLQWGFPGIGRYFLVWTFNYEGLAFFQFEMIWSPLCTQVSVQEAKKTVDLWYSDRKEVLTWQEERKKEAREKNCVHTLLGRARQFPSVAHATNSQKGHIERAAINTPVQVCPFFLFFMLPISHGLISSLALFPIPLPEEKIKRFATPFYHLYIICPKLCGFAWWVCCAGVWWV